MKKHSFSTRLTALLLVAVIILLSFSGCKNEKYTEGTSFAMGSVLTAKIYTDDEDKGKELLSLVTDAVNMADRSLSATDPESEISELNETGIIYASDFLKEVLKDSILLCNVTERKLNITMGNVTRLWGFSTESPSLPSDEDIKKELNAVDIEKILIDPNNSKVTLEDDVSIDLGAFGKGAACDAVLDAVYLHYIPLTVSLGGTVLVCGNGPSDGKWTVGIRDPFKDMNSCFGKITVSGKAPFNASFISTSGSYEKTFTENDKTYHHILDPKTGYPVENELISVTVVAHSGLIADALSTFCFIGGLNEDTLQTLSSFYAEAVFVMKDKTYYITDGLKEAFEPLSSEYTLIENYEA